MLEERKSQFRYWERKVGAFLSHLPFTPNNYTVSSLFFALLALYLVANYRFLSAFFLFFLAGILDFIDGAVARFQEKASKEGAYLDTISDRYVEGIMLISFLFLPLPEVFLPSYYWVFLALFGSLMTTYAKAAAKEKEIVGKENRKGLFGRPERIITLFLALLSLNFSCTIPVFLLIFLALFSNLTALERIFFYLHFNQKE